jgi:hypothetical protein
VSADGAILPKAGLEPLVIESIIYRVKQSKVIYCPFATLSIQFLTVPLEQRCYRGQRDRENLFRWLDQVVISRRQGIANLHLYREEQKGYAPSSQQPSVEL